jgi:hypothetical protein
MMVQKQEHGKIIEDFMPESIVSPEIDAIGTLYEQYNIDPELGLNNWGVIQLNPCFDPDQLLQYTKLRNSKRKIDEVFYSDDERNSCTVIALCSMAF